MALSRRFASCMHRYFNVIIAPNLFLRFYSRIPRCLSNSSFLLVLWDLDDYRPLPYIPEPVHRICFGTRKLGTSRVTDYRHLISPWHCCAGILAPWNCSNPLSAIWQSTVASTLKSVKRQSCYFISFVYYTYRWLCYFQFNMGHFEERDNTV